MLIKQRTGALYTGIRNPYGFVSDGAIDYVRRLFTESGAVAAEQLTHEPQYLPEQRLALAVFKNAFETMKWYVRLHNKRLIKYRSQWTLTSAKQKRLQRFRALFQKEYDWFFATNDTAPFSFERICSYLRMEPEYILRLLPHLLEQPAYTFSDIETQ